MPLLSPRLCGAGYSEGCHIVGQGVARGQFLTSGEGLFFDRGLAVLHLAEDVTVIGDEAHIEPEIVLRGIVIEGEAGLTVGLSLVEHLHRVAGDIGGGCLVVDLEDIDEQLDALNGGVGSNHHLTADGGAPVLARTDLESEHFLCICFGGFLNKLVVWVIEFGLRTTHHGK